jgi:DNA phosphorothioation-associated putative methyltransferase
MRGVGKRVRDHLYVHVASIEYLDDPGERAAIRATVDLLPSDVQSLVNVVKLNVRTGRVALLGYTAFDEDPFPALAHSWTPSETSAGLTLRTYVQSLNPPILHRKELLVRCDHPAREQWTALTKEAEGLGLFDDVQAIGFRLNWERLVQGKGYQLRGGAFVPLGNAVASEPGCSPVWDGPPVQRHLTALARSAISAPVQLLLRHGLLRQDTSFFDYGCGRGDDVGALEREAYAAAGWDPHYAPDRPRQAADVVNLGFVINVIEDPAERVEAMQGAFALARGVMSVGVMLYTSDTAGRRYRDGFLTSRGTFQKYFQQGELKDYIEHVLGREAILVGPGVAFVFKDEELEQRFVVSRYRRRDVSQRLLAMRAAKRTPTRKVASPRPVALPKPPSEPHPLLVQLWRLTLDLGRHPEESEVDSLESVRNVFGGLGRALHKMTVAFDAELLERARLARTDDLRLFFAVQQFGKRPRYRQLERRLQTDVKSFFGDYATAQAAGLSLLTLAADSRVLAQGCREAAIHGLGYLDGDHLQLHVSLVERLPAVLRAFVACGLAIYGDLSAVDIVKIHASTGKLTFQQYEDFATSPMPVMIRRVKVNVRKVDYELFDYGGRYPKPPLYRKSRYMHEEMAGYDEQEAFDAALEEAGVLGDSEYGPIAEDVKALLGRRRLEVLGMRLCRSTAIPDLDERCGAIFTYRQLIECGETQARLGLPNVPRNPESFNALHDLAEKILDPLVEYFGSIRLTYGFCSAELGRHIKSRVAPKLDQHAAHELDRNGKPICDRGGAACDLLVEDEDMREVAQWILLHLPFDRMYVYGSNRPIHVSYASSEVREAFEMRAGPSGRLMPRPLRT